MAATPPLRQLIPAALPRGIYHPLGVVFTTYGGGFYGSNEASATLELLKLYLEVQNVTVVGKFACCGKETGPAGLRDGEIPKTFGNVKLDAPVYYQTQMKTTMQAPSSSIPTWRQSRARGILTKRAI